MLDRYTYSVAYPAMQETGYPCKKRSAMPRKRLLSQTGRAGLAHTHPLLRATSPLQHLHLRQQIGLLGIGRGDLLSRAKHRYDTLCPYLL